MDIGRFNIKYGMKIIIRMKMDLCKFWVSKFTFLETKTSESVYFIFPDREVS